MNHEGGYKNLTVYQKADDLAVLVYLATRGFPKDELFGLTSQMRRCAVSVPANIVEGCGRRTKKDQAQFYYIARGSLNELEYYIDLAYKLKYVDEKKYNELIDIRSVVGRLLHGFIKSVEI